MASVKEALEAKTASYETLHTALHIPWKHYIARLLSPDSAPPHELTKRAESCSWVGAMATVAASRHAQHIGVSGVIVWTSKDLVHIVSAADRLFCVHRAHCTVEVQLPTGVVWEGQATLKLPGTRSVSGAAKPTWRVLSCAGHVTSALACFGPACSCHTAADACSRHAMQRMCGGCP